MALGGERNRLGEGNMTMSSTNPDRPRIAFISVYDSRDVHSFSGTGYYLTEYLQKNWGDVDHLGPLEEGLNIKMHLLKAKLRSAFLGKRHLADGCYGSRAIAYDHARQVQKRLRQKDYDVIVSPHGIHISLAGLETDIPIVLYTDATFASMLNFYPNHSDLLPEVIREADALEQEALSTVALAVYSSQWAANSAIDDYNTSREKVKVVPFGANIDNWPSSEEIAQRKSTAQCHLLFLGVDWQRKGGHIAVETVNELNRRGLESRLIVCGCVPPSQYRNQNIEVVGFLDKHKERDKKRFEQVLLEASYLIVPSRADATPIVFCEASAYGLPILTTNVGGIPSVVENGQNGFTLPVTADGAEFADVIEENYTDPTAYHNLCLSAREMYDTVLNWDASTTAIAEAFNSWNANRRQ